MNKTAELMSAITPSSFSSSRKATTNNNNKNVEKQNKEETNRIFTQIKLEQLSNEEKEEDSNFVAQFTDTNLMITEEPKLPVLSPSTKLYKLMHAESLDKFYLHVQDVAIQSLEYLNEQIQDIYNEFKAESKVECLNTSKVYGIYSFRRTLFTRVRLVEYDGPSVIDQPIMIKAFYIDFGETEMVNTGELIDLSNILQTIAPQAICCKLNNVQSFDHEEEKTYLMQIFQDLLEYNKFTATMENNDFSREKRRRSCVSSLPVLTQSENTTPIGVSIIIFCKEDEKEKSIDLTQYLNEMLKKRRNEVPTFKKHLLNSILECDVMVWINSANELFVRQKNSSILMAKMNDLCNVNLSTMRPLDSNCELGTCCIYIKQGQSNEPKQYKRAIVLKKIILKSNESIAHIFEIDCCKLQKHINFVDLWQMPIECYSEPPMCIQCTLNLDDRLLNDKQQAKQVHALIKQIYEEHAQSKCPLKVKFESILSHDNYNMNVSNNNSKLDEEEKSTIATLSQYMPIYVVQLYGYKMQNKITDVCVVKNLGLFNFKAEVISRLEQKLSTHPMRTMEQNQQIKNPFVYAPILPFQQLFKAKLIMVDTARHFGLIRSADYDKRNTFLSQFHHWHNEHRQTLINLFNLTVIPAKAMIGQPCAVKSQQTTQWCRGLIMDADSAKAIVYLIDYCRPVQVANERVFRLENKTFLDEPVYTYRCQLADDTKSHSLFDRYAILVNKPTTAAVEQQPNDFFLSIDENTTKPDSLNTETTAHIDLRNIELHVVCQSRARTPISALTTLINDQYTVIIVNYSRIVNLPMSPHLLNNSSMNMSNLSNSSNSPLTNVTNGTGLIRGTTTTTVNSSQKENNEVKYYKGKGGLSSPVSIEGQKMKMTTRVKELANSIDSSITKGVLVYNEKSKLATTTSTTTITTIFKQKQDSISYKQLDDENNSATENALSYPKDMMLNHKVININPKYNNNYYFEQNQKNNSNEESVAASSTLSQPINLIQRELHDMKQHHNEEEEETNNSTTNNNNDSEINFNQESLTDSTRITPCPTAPGDSSHANSLHCSQTTFSENFNSQNDLSVLTLTTVTAAIGAMFTPNRHHHNVKEQHHQTSKWVRDEEFETGEMHMMPFYAVDSKHKVKIFKGDSNNTGDYWLICSLAGKQEQNNYEQLKINMNLYYEELAKRHDTPELSFSQLITSLEKTNGVSLSNNSLSPLSKSEKQVLLDNSNDQRYFPNELCAAKVGTDWQRVKILDYNTKKAEVECVDNYCTKHSLDWSNVRKLRDDFNQPPRRAIRCKLFDDQQNIIDMPSIILDISSLMKESLQNNRILEIQIKKAVIQNDNEELFEINIFLDSKKVNILEQQKN